MRIFYFRNDGTPFNDAECYLADAFNQYSSDSFRSIEYYIEYDTSARTFRRVSEHLFMSRWAENRRWEENCRTWFAIRENQAEAYARFGKVKRRAVKPSGFAKWIVESELSS